MALSISHVGCRDEWAIDAGTAPVVTFVCLFASLHGIVSRGAADKNSKDGKRQAPLLVVTRPSPRYTGSTNSTGAVNSMRSPDMSDGALG